MSVNYSVVHVTASAPLTPHLSFGEEVVKFVRTKPLGAGGGLIILAMLFVALFAAALAPFDLAPDGRILAATLIEPPTSSPIILVVDWLADLKK